MPTRVNLTPSPHYLGAVRHQGLSWFQCLAELCDNAYDADASAVWITLGRNFVQVEDNGHGCPDPVTMLTLGDRLEQESTILGRYGCGLKDSAISLGDRVMITTR
jgi:hypothetical protein